MENLGKVADLTPTSAPVAVGDSGTIAGQSFIILGKVQLQHDMGGVWEEWYLGYADGQWGWLAYAQGMFYATWKVDPAPAVPSMRELQVEAAVNLGQSGAFRVLELKQATISSAAGELPFSPKTGEVRYYADLVGPSNGFATIDWGQGTEAPEVFLGYQLLESQLQITQQAERPQQQVKLEGLTCPGCGAPLNIVSGDRVERVACQYCGTVSEAASQQIIARQEQARAEPLIPMGSTGALDNVQYTVIGFVQRSTEIEGERFSWSEYLLFAPGLGFRWLVEDEGTWRFVSPVNLAEVDLSSFPNQIGYNGKIYRMRNSNTARVDYVIGEFYWKVQLGETVQVMDFESGTEVVSREAVRNEVHWSISPVVPWNAIAAAFAVTAAPPPPMAMGGGGDDYDYDYSDSGSSSGSKSGTAIIVLIIVVILVLIFCGMCVGMCPGGSSSGSRSGSGVGGPIYGGGWSSGK